MPYDLSKKDFERTMALDPVERYRYFVETVAREGEAWILKKGDDLAGFSDGEGNPGIPFWPHPDFAAVVATGELAGCTAANIDIESLVNTWLPDMAEEGVRAMVFISGNHKGISKKARDMAMDLVEAVNAQG